jgi:protein-tyrosine phosphatase
MTMTRSRHVPFEGARNVRDLGGYPTTDGGTTRWGLVYRADGLQSLTPGDVERYAELGIRTTYDLRRDSEREQRPNRVPSTSLCITTPMDEAGVTIEATTMFDERSGEVMLRTIYGGLLTYSGALLGTMFTEMSAPEGTPALFHCHAGKDRTGIVAAVLLDALRVEREVILDDYVMTTEFRKREHQEDSFQNLVKSGMAPEAAAGVLGAPRWAMAETLAELDSVYGGVDSYLVQQCAMEPTTIDRLRGQLVEH